MEHWPSFESPCWDPRFRPTFISIKLKHRRRFQLLSRQQTAGQGQGWNIRGDGGVWPSILPRHLVDSSHGRKVLRHERILGYVQFIWFSHRYLSLWAIAHYRLVNWSTRGEMTTLPWIPSLALSMRLMQIGRCITSWHAVFKLWN